MNRNLLNFVIDGVSMLIVLGLSATGLLVRFVLPPGSGSRRTLWTLGRHDWGGVHFWLAVGAATLLLVHIAMHWQWVCTTTMRLFGRRAVERGSRSRIVRNVAGVGLVVVLIAAGSGLVAIGRHNVVDSLGADVTASSAEMPAESHEQGEQLIRGSMTLGEAAKVLGIPVGTLRERLKLPADVPADEQLGRLRQKYGFTMNQVRAAAD